MDRACNTHKKEEIAYIYSVLEVEGKRSRGNSRRRWEDIIRNLLSRWYLARLSTQKMEVIWDRSAWTGCVCHGIRDKL
jgi:hypothetical protein